MTDISFFRFEDRKYGEFIGLWWWLRYMTDIAGLVQTTLTLAYHPSSSLALKSTTPTARATNHPSASASEIDAFISTLNLDSMVRAQFGNSYSFIGLLTYGY